MQCQRPGPQLTQARKPRFNVPVVSHRITTTPFALNTGCQVLEQTQTPAAYIELLKECRVFSGPASHEDTSSTPPLSQ